MTRIFLSLLVLMVFESNAPSPPVAIVNGLLLESNAGSESVAQTEVSSRME